MTEKACAICTRRHETGNVAAPLQCRALPPVQGLVRDAIFPTVAATYYCHAYFALDVEAARARAQAAEESARLAELKAETRVAVSIDPEKEVAAAKVWEDVSGVSAISVAVEAGAEAGKRARRARSGDDPKLL